MKKISTFLISIVIAAIAIYFLQPFINEYKEKQKYSFNVTSSKGELTKESFKDKALGIYFGYTYCPDVCPTSLSSLAQALNTFSQEKQNKFRGLFISVDPKRDTVKTLDEYSKYFHKNFLGATSNKENIDDITKRYGTFYEKVYLEGSKMDYSVSHTSYIYLFDKKGNFSAKIDHFSDPEFIKKALEKIL
ncbi:SCO family protein [Arcobacter sp. LA11]|uniref:SCO family protein n=1 Tax=Arcobacter sp. LA11 TaxID=1898176 RepID=UPI000932CAF9|nr:SCO family protein [Arcobacter sp. LA11]